MAIQNPYRPVFDAQRHYRTLLQSTARPGLIGQLEDADLEVPAELNRASALMGLALFTSDSSFALVPERGAASEFIRRETSAPAAALDKADFVIVFDSSRASELQYAKHGTLSFPDTAGTAIVQVGALSPAPIVGGFQLTLSGPGVETTSTVYVAGVDAKIFEMHQEINSEFPLGMDFYLTCDSLSAGPCVLALPRTTRIKWETTKAS